MLRYRTGSETTWSRWIEVAVVIVLWLLVAAIALVFRALDPEHPFSIHTIAVTATEYVPWMILTPAIFALARRFPPERENWGWILLLHLGLAVLVAFGIRQVQQAVFDELGPPPQVVTIPGDGPYIFPGPPPGLAPRRRLGPDGPNGLQFFPLQVLIYLMVLGVGFARTYAAQLRQRQAETARLASQLSEARLQALRMQLNPHFLFNALNAVSALADDNPAAVRRIIARLSALLRRVLDSNATQEVSLRDELTSLRDYLSIQKIRFGDGLDVAEEIEPEALPALVPAFILQPLAENAVEHAAARRISGVALIVLRARYDQHAGRVIITVSDNGPGTDGGTASVQSEHTGIGLRNIRERLEAHYGTAASLTLRQSAEGGTDAEVTLPYQAGGHNNAMISNV